MSWKESKVRLLPPPQALNPQDPKQQSADRKPDIQDLFLLASQATALRNTPLSSSASEYATVTTVSVTGSNPVSMAGPSTHLQPSTVHYPGTSIKIEPVILPSSSSSTNYVPLDSAMMPPPPPPPPRPPASPGVSSTSGDSCDSDTAHYSPNIPNNPTTANNCQQPGGSIPPALLGKKKCFFAFIRSMCYSLEACCPTETLLKTGRTRLLLSRLLLSAPHNARFTKQASKHAG